MARGFDSPSAGLKADGLGSNVLIDARRFVSITYSHAESILTQLERRAASTTFCALQPSKGLALVHTELTAADEDTIDEVPSSSSTTFGFRARVALIMKA